MPWKGEKDPYRIWISEIILQQTRVDQGLEYYNRFIAAFPAIDKLASAKDEKVMKYWEGLGYYSRCRNLLHTARFIQNEYKGKFPDTYDKIIALKGIGPYTAAAIASFAFNLPYAVVDGNVFRVLSRYFGIQEPTDSNAGKKLFSALADQLLDRKQPGIYNQAIMDFGAVICKPSAPLCAACPMQPSCVAFSKKLVSDLPVKEKKITVRKRWFTYLVFTCKGSVALRKRTGKDIWKDLYEFPMIETDREVDAAVVLKDKQIKDWLKAEKPLLRQTCRLEQLLTHQRIHGQFLELVIQKKPAGAEDWIWIPVNKMDEFGYPGLIHKYLEERSGKNT